MEAGKRKSFILVFVEIKLIDEEFFYFKLLFQQLSLLRVLQNECEHFSDWRYGGFLAQKFNRITNVEPCINVQSKNFSSSFWQTLVGRIAIYYDNLLFWDF